jgi:hypothetical protein
VTRAALTTKNPRERSLLTRLLTKRAGVNTSYNLVAYSSMEWAPCASIRNKNANWLLCSTVFGTMLTLAAPGEQLQEQFYVFGKAMV